MDRALLKSMAKHQIKGNLGTLFVIFLVTLLISVGLSFVPLVGSIASMLITAAISLAMAGVYLGMIAGRKPEVGDMFSQLRNFWPAFKVSFLSGLLVMLWSLLLVIPGIIKSIAYSQSMYILAEEPTMGAREALKKSQEMMKGHKMEYFVLGLSFLGWEILGIFTFGLLYIWLLPYMGATYANFYNTLKSGTCEA